jgi:predicted HTH domain antitoxin
MERVTTRISEDDEKALAELQAEMSADRSEVLRWLIQRGLDDWRKERALDQLRDHSITLRKAADLADVSDVEMLVLAAEQGIDVGYTTDDLERDLDHIC